MSAAEIGFAVYVVVETSADTVRLVPVGPPGDECSFAADDGTYGENLALALLWAWWRWPAWEAGRT